MVRFALAKSTLGLESTCGLEGHVGSTAATHDADAAGAEVTGTMLKGGGRCNERAFKSCVPSTSVFFEGAASSGRVWMMLVVSMIVVRQEGLQLSHVQTRLAVAIRSSSRTRRQRGGGFLE